MMITRGTTTHFAVAYDDALTGMGIDPIPLADAVLASCEHDFQVMSALFGRLVPTSLPININLVPGMGGAGWTSVTDVKCYVSMNTDAAGLPSLVAAEVAEILMYYQHPDLSGWGWGFSNGEGLSRAIAFLLYPNLRIPADGSSRWLTCNDWLNSTGPSRPDWVSKTERTDGNYVSFGCASLFLNYLAYQLNFSWPEIVQAAAPTLALTAGKLGLASGVFNEFAALLARHFPTTTTVRLLDDNPFPLARFPDSGTAVGMGEILLYCNDASALDATVAINRSYQGKMFVQSGHALLLIAQVPPGTYRIEISKPGYRPYVTTIVVGDGRTEVDFALDPNPFPSTGTARGTGEILALCTDTSADMANLYVNEVSQGQMSVQGSNALSLVAQVPPGFYPIRVSKTGFRDFVTVATVFDGQRKEVVFDLEP